MRSLFLLILFLLIFIAQIGILVLAIQKKKRSNWIFLHIFNVVSVLLAVFLLIYFENQPVTYAFGNLAEFLACFGAIFLHLIMSLISVCCGIVIFELNLRKQNKNYVTPFCLILATLFIYIGIVSLGHEFLVNYNIKKTTGVVTDIVETNHHHYDEDIIVDYEMNGVKQQIELRRHNEEIGDKVDVSVKCNSDNECQLSYTTDNKVIYIPSFVIAILIIIFRFKDGINKKEEQN